MRHEYFKYIILWNVPTSMITSRFKHLVLFSSYPGNSLIYTIFSCPSLIIQFAFFPCKNYNTFLFILQGGVPWWTGLENAGLDIYFSNLAMWLARDFQRKGFICRDYRFEFGFLSILISWVSVTWITGGTHDLVEVISHYFSNLIVKLFQWPFD